MRQALAGMLWSKQFYYFDVDMWLGEHGADPLVAPSGAARNREWAHMVNDRRDLDAGQVGVPLVRGLGSRLPRRRAVARGLDFAKDQLELMLREMYLHPSGQIPAYEWNFGDVNPPVHAWATLFLYRMEQALRGTGDVDFLKRSFGKLLANFTWWVNRKDRFGKNVFEGGFLGLDNIGVFDRSAPLPTGGYLEQADGTAWMALFCQNMLEIAVEIAADDPTYEDMAAKFVDHFLSIAKAHEPRRATTACGTRRTASTTTCCGCPTARATRLKVRSMVGLLPLCATTVVEPWQRERVPRLVERIKRCGCAARPSCSQSIHPTGDGHQGHGGPRHHGASSTPSGCAASSRGCSTRTEFLSPYGIRALSRYHLEHPYVVRRSHGEEYRVGYVPGGIGQRDVRRQLELARADLDAGQRRCSSARCCSSTRTTATTSRSSARPAPGGR